MCLLPTLCKVFTCHILFCFLVDHLSHFPPPPTKLQPYIFQKMLFNLVEEISCKKGIAIFYYIVCLHYILNALINLQPIYTKEAYNKYSVCLCDK